MTGDEQYAKAIEAAEEKEKKMKKKEPTKKNQSKPKANLLKEYLDDGESSEEESEEDIDEDDVLQKGYMFPPTSERQTFLYLRDLWENINPPRNRENAN